MMEILQCLLEPALRQRQAIAITRMKRTQRVSGANAIKQRKLSLGCRIPRPGDKFCVQHFPFPPLIVRVHARMREHV
ncbi:hypothetical protein D3C85_1631250 [compost metagenome]